MTKQLVYGVAVAAVALAILVLVTNAANAAIITINNPSFETAVSFPWPGYGDVPGWIDNTPGGSTGINPASGGGTPFADNGSIPDGTQTAFTQNTSSLSQTVTGLTPGRQYWASYHENARAGTTNPNPTGSATFAGSTVVAAHVLAPVGNGNSYNLQISSPITAAASSHDLELINNGVGLDNAIVYDDVIVWEQAAINETPTNGPNGFTDFEKGLTNWTQAPADSSWQFVAVPNSGITPEGAAFNDGSADTPSGNESAYAQATSEFSDVFGTFSTDGVYTLTFWEAHRNSTGTMDFEVLLDGVALTFGGSASLNTTSGTAFTQIVSDPFSVSSDGPKKLTFRGLNSAGGDHSFLIDDVSFQVVSWIPEPATSNLATLGLLGLLACGRRRRR